MKAVPLTFQGVLAGLLAASLQAQEPVLVTPGTATWQNTDIGTGTRTEFSLTGNTVLDWERLNLKSGSEIDFNFLSGDSVLNLLTGGKTHRIDGAVTSNGNVGFFSPNASLVVNGSITGKSVTLSTLDVDTADFMDGGGLALSGGDPRFRPLTIRGNVNSTNGDVLVAGGAIQIDSSGKVEAKSGGILYAAGGTVQVEANGSKRLTVTGDGQVLHSGDSNAGQMEIAAGTLISNAGRLGNGNSGSRVFVQVGENGRIENQGRGVFVSAGGTIGGEIGEGIEILWRDYDAPQLVADASFRIPAVTRPNGSRATISKTMTSTTPISASSDAGRAAKRSPRKVVSKDTSNSMLRRTTFFGMRGGGKVASR